MKNPFFTIFGNYDVINELCRQNEVTKQTSLNSNDYKTHWCEIVSSFKTIEHELEILGVTTDPPSPTSDFLI